MSLESEADRQKRVAEAEKYRKALEFTKGELERQAVWKNERVDSFAHRKDDFYGQTIRSLARLDDPANPANNFTEQDKADIAAGKETHDSVHEKKQKVIWKAEAESKKTSVVRSITPLTVLQGDTRGLTQNKGLHTPTMAEIIANANKPRPTQVVFDTNSDHMRQIDPLAPYTDFSGNFPKTVNPLKPGPKISGLG